MSLSQLRGNKNPKQYPWIFERSGKKHKGPRALLEILYATSVNCIKNGFFCHNIRSDLSYVESEPSNLLKTRYLEPLKKGIAEVAVDNEKFITSHHYIT